MTFKREKYLKETFLLIQKKKIESFKIREICHQLNVCHTSFYKTYDSRDSFLLDLTLFISYKIGIDSFKTLSLKHDSIIENIFKKENKVALINFFSLININEVISVLMIFYSHKYLLNSEDTGVLKNYLRIVINTIKFIVENNVNKEIALKCLNQIKDIN